MNFFAKRKLSPAIFSRAARFKGGGGLFALRAKGWFKSCSRCALKSIKFFPFLHPFSTFRCAQPFLLLFSGLCPRPTLTPLSRPTYFLLLSVILA